MKWFKFYGQDWLTDLKILQMRLEDRICYLTLLCLASSSEKEGLITNCEEDTLIELTHLSGEHFDRARGCLKRFVDNKMITNDCYHNVIILNFGKRQGKNLSGYERVKRYRERKKCLDTTYSKISMITNDNINDNANDNARLEKNRIDKNIISESNDSQSKKKL